jgi:hypothetical protein
MDEAKAKRESKKLHDLFVQMVDLLISYEIEESAYRTVLGAAENEFTKIDQGKDPGLHKAVAGLIQDQTFRVSAEQRFVKISQLRKGLTEQNLDLALSGIKDVIARKTGQPMPD